MTDDILLTKSRAVEFWTQMVRSLADHCEHPWEQVGPCVYCTPCNVRLYQGIVLTDAEKADLLREVDECP